MFLKKITMTRTELKELAHLYAHWKECEHDRAVFAFCKERKINIKNVPELIYSERQRKFISDVTVKGLEVIYTYNPYGNHFCPAVIVGKISDLETDTLPVSENFGLKYVLYVPS